MRLRPRGVVNARRGAEGELGGVAVGIGRRGGDEVSIGHGACQLGAEVDIPPRIRLDHVRAEEILALAVAARVAAGTAKEAQREGRGRRAVQAPANRRGDGVGDDAQQHGEILHFVRPAVGVQFVIRRDAIPTQVDAQRPVAVNSIAQQEILLRYLIFDHDASALIVGDEVLARRRPAANTISAGPLADEDADGIGSSNQAAAIDADAIANDNVVHRAAAADLYAGALIPTDKVIGDGILGGPLGNSKAGFLIGDSVSAADIHTDEVARDGDVMRARHIDLDAGAGVPADQIIRDGVVRRAVIDQESAKRSVGDREAAGGIDANEVALDAIVTHVAAGEIDAAAFVPTDKVLPGGRIAADVIVLGIVQQTDAKAAIRLRGRAGKIDADVIPLDGVAQRHKAAQHKPILVVAGDVIPLPQRPRADAAISANSVMPAADGDAVAGEVDDLHAAHGVVIRGE